LKCVVRYKEKGKQAYNLNHIVMEFEDGNESEIQFPFREMNIRTGQPDPISLDFLVLACVCYGIDKSYPRDNTRDFWTRDIQVELPVSDPGKWNEAREDISKALGFLSGDEWSFTFSKITVSPYQELEKPVKKTNSMNIRFTDPDIVCLFSGGLDSLTGGIDLLHNNPGKKILFLGHRDAPCPTQSPTFSQIEKKYTGQVDLLQVRVSLVRKKGSRKENTLRSRSLLFLGLAIYAARSVGENTPVYAPENGFIALNVPLTPSRAGSCSTRTMHPYYLNCLRAALAKVDILNPIINPFESKTKGEILKECSDSQLLKLLYDKSQSCSHPTRRGRKEAKGRWVNISSLNCGYCVPCMIRRAAIYGAGLHDDGQEYGFDVLEKPQQDFVKSDYIAMRDFLSRKKSADDFEKAVRRIVSLPNIAECSKMLERGQEELQNWFNHGENFD